MPYPPVPPRWPAVQAASCRCTICITVFGGSLSKIDRIKRLMPLFEQAKIILLPHCRRTLYDGTTPDLVQDFIEQEYTAFPVSQHDDMLDALSRICDDKELGLRWPQGPFTSGVGGRPSRPSSYISNNGDGAPMSMWQRHKAKVAGRGTQAQRPRPRPQESGIWAKPGWK